METLEKVWENSQKAAFLVLPNFRSYSHSESSANIAILALEIAFGIPLANNKSNIGPSIDPCGNPDPTSVQVEQVPFTTTLCSLTTG